MKEGSHRARRPSAAGPGGCTDVGFWPAATLDVGGPVLSDTDGQLAGGADGGFALSGNGVRRRPRGSCGDRLGRRLRGSVILRPGDSSVTSGCTPGEGRGRRARVGARGAVAGGRGGDTARLVTGGLSGRADLGPVAMVRREPWNDLRTARPGSCLHRRARADADDARLRPCGQRGHHPCRLDRSRATRPPGTGQRHTGHARA